MAKVSLTKVCPIKKKDNLLVKIGDTEVEIIQYLPINEKGTFITEVINDIIDNTYMINPVRYEVIFNIKLLQVYTNFNFTETMLKDLPKLYDMLVLNNIINEIKKNIPEEELNMLKFLLEQSLTELKTYGSSALGIIQTINADQIATQDNVNTLMSALSDPEQLTLVKDILNKLG